MSTMTLVVIGRRAGIVCRRALRTTKMEDPPRSGARWWSSHVDTVSNENSNVPVIKFRKK